MMKSMDCEFCKLTLELAALEARDEAKTVEAGGCYVKGLMESDEKSTITIYGKVTEYHRLALLDLLCEIDKATRREYLEENNGAARSANVVG